MGWIGCTEDGGDETKFDICLDVSQSEVSGDISWIDDFISAKERWESIIVGDEPSGSIPPALTQQIPVCTGLPNVIDDLYICVSNPAIDGPGGVLAGGGPTLRRTGTNIPIAGVMIFDTSDITVSRARGIFDRIVLHEMGHVFGIGVLFEDNGLINPDTLDYRRNTFAGLEWESLGCTTELPIEKDFGPGTAGAHWDEVCLGRELMTGVAEVDGSEALSRITIASLRDLGYEVDMEQADPFSAAEIDSSCCNPGVRRRTTNNDDRSRHRRRRPLSQEGLTIATEFGKRELTKLNNFIAEQRRTMNIEDNVPENEEYIVDIPHFSVLYQEGDQVYTVIVYR